MYGIGSCTRREGGYSYIEAQLWFGFTCPIQTRIKGLLGSQITHSQIRITLRNICWHAMQRSKFTFLNAFQTSVVKLTLPPPILKP